MEASGLITCPGCGLKLTNQHLTISNNYNASAECNELFNTLSGYTLSLNNTNFIHQYVVDAYGAQHAGGITKNIRVMFSLIGLCLAAEHNYTGRQVQLVHMKIRKQQWETLQLPRQKALITIADIIHANGKEGKIIMIKNWVKSVWDSWSLYHDLIRQQTLLYI